MVSALRGGEVCTRRPGKKRAGSSAAIIGEPPVIGDHTVAIGAVGSGGVRVLQPGVPGLMGVTQEQVDAITARLRERQIPGSYGVRFTSAGARRAWGNAVVGARKPVHEVAARNGWQGALGFTVPAPLGPASTPR